MVDDLGSKSGKLAYILLPSHVLILTSFLCCAILSWCLFIILLTSSRHFSFTPCLLRPFPLPILWGKNSLLPLIQNDGSTISTSRFSLLYIRLPPQWRLLISQYLSYDSMRCLRYFSSPSRFPYVLFP